MKYIGVFMICGGIAFMCPAGWHWYQIFGVQMLIGVGLDFRYDQGEISR